MTTQTDPARTAVTPEDCERWRKGHVPVLRGTVPGGTVPVGMLEYLRAKCSCGSLVYPCRELRLLDALAACEARLAESVRENARLALIEAEVRSIVADINDGKADSYWLRLAKVAMPDLGFPSWNDLHPVVRSAGEGAE